MARGRPHSGLRTRGPLGIRAELWPLGACNAAVELSEAPHKAPVSLRVAIQVLDDARIVHCCRNTAKSPDMIAKRLLGEALDRGATDNVTVVVVFLRDLT